MVRKGEGNGEDWEEAKRQADEVVGHLLNICRSGVTPPTGDVWMIEPVVPQPGELLLSTTTPPLLASRA